MVVKEAQHETYIQKTPLPLPPLGQTGDALKRRDSPETLGILFLMQRSAAARRRLGARNQQPTDRGRGQNANEDGLQGADPNTRCHNARYDGKQGASHLRKYKYKGQRGGVELVREELRAQRNACREQRAGEEADETDGDRGCDDVGDPESQRKPKLSATGRGRREGGLPRR